MTQRKSNIILAEPILSLTLPNLGESTRHHLADRQTIYCSMECFISSKLLKKKKEKWSYNQWLKKWVRHLCPCSRKSSSFIKDHMCWYVYTAERVQTLSFFVPATWLLTPMAKAFFYYVAASAFYVIDQDDDIHKEWMCWRFHSLAYSTGAPCWETIYFSHQGAQRMLLAG